MTTMLPTLTQLVILFFTLFAIGGIGSLLFARSDENASLWGTLFAAFGSVSAFAAGAFAVFQTHAITYSSATMFPFLTLEIHVDKLAGVFLAIIALVSFLATIYGSGYMRHYFGKYSIGSFYFFYNLFLGSMMLVVLANQALFFLVAWELMSLASYFLVVFDHEKEEHVRAGFLYFIITHIATACIVLMFLICYRATGSFDFDVWRGTLSALPPLVSAAVFVLAILGFGTKAGMIPLHVWLPSAHPAAPSQVSALMSGVMIKTGIYMLMRITFDFYRDTPLWLGLTVLFLGAISSVLGVLYALGEHDIKRLLAYHSIENIGIILLGLGAALVLRTMGEGTLALLALAAAIFHTANHAIFKSLLFMSAGSVVLATHTRNIEEYGGLIKRMPETALFFLIGSIAISGIIPFNGFVSEWLTFQSLIGGVHVMSIAAKAVMIGGIAALALTGGLACACFVKAFGVTFLARPRSREAEHAREGTSGMRIGMAVLSVVALLLGVFGASAAKLFMNVGGSLAGMGTALPGSTFGSQHLVVHGGFASLNMPALFVGLLIALLLAWLIGKGANADPQLVRGKTWDCGFPLTPRMEITATSFSRSLITIFKDVIHPVTHVERTFVDPTKKTFVRSISVSMEIRELYRRRFYDPFAHMVLRLAAQATKIQSGSTHMYLLYMMLILIVLLFWATR